MRSRWSRLGKRAARPNRCGLSHSSPPPPAPLSMPASTPPPRAASKPPPPFDTTPSTRSIEKHQCDQDLSLLSHHFHRRCIEKIKTGAMMGGALGLAAGSGIGIFNGFAYVPACKLAPFSLSPELHSTSIRSVLWRAPEPTSRNPPAPTLLYLRRGVGAAAWPHLVTGGGGSRSCWRWDGGLSVTGPTVFSLRE